MIGDWRNFEVLVVGPVLETPLSLACGIWHTTSQHQETRSYVIRCGPWGLAGSGRL